MEHLGPCTGLAQDPEEMSWDRLTLSVGHLVGGGVKGDQPVSLVRPEADDQVWCEQHGVVVVQPVCVEDQDGIVQVLTRVCALPHYLDENGVQCSASLSGGGGGGGPKQNISRASLHTKTQTVMCLTLRMRAHIS